ncbi:hypothetical protein HPP92_016623 [Vanilla planifolia]|uniref:Uncharacterized protein n=1 Tax=Vanilla planifolia TaxID=51239 RepID=A0A835QQM6_VANPL|nr:hypothetical protein HPP92_016623 [Vanilla planifolia]
MHGREGEEWKQRRHMWSVPVLGTETSAAQKQADTSPLTVPAVDSVQTSPDSFLKDGRKIRVGDCALFQAGNAPPFIGIIRWLSTDKEAYLKLCVNWLYRPADVKLAKGILLEAAPNEVFYSFHKDVISAASLLHPCKVAFLCKGVELPLGISSFVCRRVYDIANKCLWWLSDQDYINEHQEEVDQLLDKTRLEMHAAVQSGGRSPKRLNGPSSAQQLKAGSDSVQNNGSSLNSQMKGKKRERSEQITDSSKRERISKADDGDSSGFKFENNMIKSEISKITEKGALVSTDGVEKLVQLMLVDSGKKIDLTGRVLFADVIAATERIDCLNKFVQIRGVTVLDEWLQEAHKGKIGDGNSPKESDKAVEELLLALLRALDKLPVNLNALQTCNIGKSVNHLRSHKNLEIQKKARSLVDTWKKRVDAEIKTNDAKPTGSSQTVAWPVKPGFSEVSHVGNRRIGSGELSVKGSAVQQIACKGLVGKSVHADATVKSATLVVASGKLQSSVAAVGISPKDSPSKVVGGVGASDPPQVVIKEEKSSSSSQSQNNSQSCSSDHGKTVGSSLKEDARSSTAVSVNATKTSGVSSRHRRSSNGYLASNISGGQKESDPCKSSLVSQNLTSGKILQAGGSCERTGDVPTSDSGLGHRLIVRLPNPGRSPARNNSGGCMEDPVAGSRASSPGVLDKHDHGDCKVIGWNDSSRTPIAADVNAESWQSNDAKDGLVGSDEGDRSSTVIPDEERKHAEDSSRVAENYRTACSSSSLEKGPGVAEPNRRKSLSSMNALIESCVKYCEVRTLSGGDDVGMNLLASVAAGEISKKDVVSPVTSPRGSLMAEDPCICTNEAKPTILAIDSSCQNLVQSSELVDFDSKRHGKDDAPMLMKNEVEEVDTVCQLEDNQTSSSLLEDKVTQNDVKQEFDREVELQNNEDKRIDGEIGKSGSESIAPVDKIRINSSVCEKNAEDEVTKVEASEADQKPQSGTETGIEVVEGKVEDASTSTIADKISCPENADTSKKFDGMDGQCHEHSEGKDPSILSSGSKPLAGPSSSQHDVTNGAEPLRRKSSLETHSTDMVSTFHQEAEACPKMSAADGERKDELASSTEVSTAEQDAVAKLDFDLNEGIIGEDVNQNEPVPTVLPVSSPSVRMSNLSSLVTSPTLAGTPAFITVAAPAKGPLGLLKIC